MKKCNFKFEKENRLSGVSGIMRVKNDAEFISLAIDSCIDALDELIIVYNDCSDESPQIIEQKRLQYPQKIKVFEYTPKVYSVNLTKEEYEFAKSFPPDSEHLLCNYYNYALSKISFQYALKIDADQIYFTEELKAWCDAYRTKRVNSIFKSLCGAFFWFYVKMTKLLGNRLNRVVPLIPFGGRSFFIGCYKLFAKNAISLFGAQISLAGLNIFCSNDECFVSMGKCNDQINILPPYNGTGDHLIFEAKSSTYYEPFDSEDYNRQRSDKFSLIEKFVGDKYPIPVGVFWFHMNAMRKNVRDRVAEVKRTYPEYFVAVEDFLDMDYMRNMEKMIDPKMAAPNERALFQLLQLDPEKKMLYKYLNRVIDE